MASQHRSKGQHPHTHTHTNAHTLPRRVRVEEGDHPNRGTKPSYNRKGIRTDNRTDLTPRSPGTQAIRTHQINKRRARNVRAETRQTFRM